MIHDHFIKSQIISGSKLKTSINLTMQVIFIANLNFSPAFSAALILTNNVLKAFSHSLMGV
jgi:hypothetical protein